MDNKTLVCLDGSKMAEEILPFVAESCRLSKSEIVMLQVITTHITIPPPESMHMLTLGRESKPDTIRTTDVGKSTTLEPKVGLELKEIERQQGEAKAYLEGVAQPLRSPVLKIKTLTLEGEVAATILKYAINNRISLIAMTTHGSGGLKRGALGRVAQAVLNESVIPVLTVKPKGRAV